MINFSLISFLLQVNQLSYAFLPENVVAAANSLLESEPKEQLAQIPEVDVGIRLSFENPGAPMTLNVRPQIDLGVGAGQPRPGDYNYAINNSFGFGGHNVSLVFGS